MVNQVDVINDPNFPDSIRVAPTGYRPLASTKASEGWRPYYNQIYFRFPFLDHPEVPYSIPVPPENIIIQNDQITRTYELISVGEAIGIGGKKLERLSWQSHFVLDYDDCIEPIEWWKHRSPEWWIDCIKATQLRQTYADVTIANTNFNRNKMVIQSFKHSFVPGPPGDAWYEINLIEYKQGTLRRYDGTDFPSLYDRERPFGITRSTWTVEQNQSILDVAAAVYNDSGLWRTIWNANFDEIFEHSTGEAIIKELLEPESIFGIGLNPQQAQQQRMIDFFKNFVNYLNGNDLPEGLILSIPPDPTLGSGG